MAVDNCIVEMDSVEPPVADGSSLTFVRLIEQAGIQKLDMPRRVLTVRRQHLVQEEDKFIAILPYDGFRITFTSINPHPLLGVQFSDTESQKTIIYAIYLCPYDRFYEELAMLKKLGLGKAVRWKIPLCMMIRHACPYYGATMNWSGIKSWMSSGTWLSWAGL